MTPAFLDDRDDLPVFIHSELDDMQIGCEAFRVYCHLVRRVGRNDTAFPSYRSIGNCCFASDFPNSEVTRRKHAFNAMKELIARGLVTSEKRVNASNIYRLTPRKYWVKPDELSGSPTDPPNLSSGSVGDPGGSPTDPPGSPTDPGGSGGDPGGSVGDLIRYSTKGTPLKELHLRETPIVPTGDMCASQATIDIFSEPKPSEPDPELFAEVQDQNPVSGQRPKSAKEDKSSGFCTVEVPTVQKGIDFDEFRAVYNRCKPPSFAQLQVLNDKRKRIIKGLVKDCGSVETALIALENALAYACVDNWYATKTLSFENFASKDKILQLHERQVSAPAPISDADAKFIARAREIDAGLQKYQQPTPTPPPEPVSELPPNRGRDRYLERFREAGAQC